MKLRICVDIDKWLLYFTFLEMLLLRWVLVGQDTIIYIFCTIIVFRLFLLSKAQKRKCLKNLYLIALIYIYIIFRSLFASPVNWKFLFDNLRTMSLPLIIIIYFGYLITAKRKLVQDTFLNLTSFLNFYYVINTVIILIQYNIKFFLMPTERITNNYYQDHLAGLLGIEGTHRLAAFTVFLVLMNLYKIGVEKKGTSSRLLAYICVAMIIVVAFYTSAMNDNNMMYILIPVFLLLYYMTDSKNSRGKIFKVAVGCVVAIIVVYLVANTSILNNLGDIRIASIFKNTVQGIRGGALKDERFTHLIYALVQNKGIFLGVGFASLRFRQDSTITAVAYIYRNFGMNDIAPLISLGGFLFYALYMGAITKIIVPIKAQRRTRKYIFVILLIFTYYHRGVE